MVVNLQPRIGELPSFEVPPSPMPDGETDADLQRFLDSAEFPVASLNIIQRDMVESIVSTYGQDPGVVGLGSIAVIGGAMGRAFCVEGAVPGQVTYGNTMVLISAMRSDGKGTTAKKLMAPLISRHSQLQQDYRQNGRPQFLRELKQARSSLDALYKSKDQPASIDELVRLERRVEELERLLSLPPALYVGSATGAALVQVLGRNDEIILLFSPEAGDPLKVVLGRYTKDGGTDCDLLLAGYSVETFSEARVGRGNHHFERPCVSVLWYVQPSLLRDLLAAKEAMERGLCARFLFASSPRNVVPFDNGTARAIPDIVQNNWSTAIDAILSARDRGESVLTCHPDAMELFLAFHNEVVTLRNGPLRQFQGDFGRARENAVRVALGQAVLDATSRGELPTMIYPDHAQRGIDVVRYSLATFAKCLLPLREEIRMNRARKIQEICGGINGRVTVKILKNNHGFDEVEIEELLTLYPQYLRGETLPTTTRGGRPSRTVVRVG